MSEQYPIAAVCRLRIGNDGEGIRTLVLVYGCPLHCKYCLNPFTRDKKVIPKLQTAEELYQGIQKDRLYLLASNGGVTFGGGEPLLYPELIRDFRKISDSRYSICVETSVNVPWENIEQVLDDVDHFYIDIKTTDKIKYHEYTHGDYEIVYQNLIKLSECFSKERITIRIPEIFGFCDKESQEKSKKTLKKMGFNQFDLFKYRVIDNVKV